MTGPKTGVVLGTYGRVSLLQSSVESVRRNAGVPVTFYVVDGGSVDGSREWAASQSDIVFLGQRGTLTGATRAFNAGFALAIVDGCQYIHHTNDDAILLTPNALRSATQTMEEDPGIGCVAFAFDLRGPFGFDCVHGKTYSNFGLIRTKAGIEVAEAQGDPSGRNWWNPIYRTYGADSEFGCWLWKLGWKVVQAPELRVHDQNHQDELRKLNEAENPERADSKLFWSRWASPESLQPSPQPVLGMTDDRWKGAKVHLGCGGHRLQGWVNVDGLAAPWVDLVCDAFVLFRNIPADSLVHVYWSHGPEHIHPDRLPKLLRLIHRALAPGGKLTMATIDFEGIFLNRFKTSNNGSAWNAALYGECDSHHHPYLSHKQCFTQGMLFGLLREAGFSKGYGWSPETYPEVAALNDYALSCRAVTCFAEGVK